MVADKISDVLEQLFEFKWRDVSFPVSDFTTDIEHDQVPHEWPDRDGAHVEATGRKSLVHRASIHFRNGISPGLSETWNVGNQALYPTVFRAWLTAFTTRSSGPLQHPELGVIQCKPKQGSIRWVSTRRDGCDIQASWIESLDDTVSDFEDILARKSPVPESHVAASDLDAQLTQYPNPTVQTPSTALSFTSEINKITNAFDAASLVSAQAAGRINHVLYRVQSLEDRVLGFRDNTAWPIINSCERLKSALFDMQALLLTSDRDVAYYLVKKDSTLAALCVPTKSKIADLMTLNPKLASSPVVPQGTIVRHYTKSA